MTDKIIKEFREKFADRIKPIAYMEAKDLPKDLETFLTKALKQAEEDTKRKLLADSFKDGFDHICLSRKTSEELSNLKEK